MLTYQGKYAKADVMIDEIDQTTASQIHEFLNHETFAGQKIVIMPDTHAGKGAVIGFTMDLGDTITPNIVGVDVACGLMSVKLPKGTFDGLDRKEVDIAIRRTIPMGAKVRSKPAIDMERHFPLEEVNKEIIVFTKKFADRYGSKHDFTPIMPQYSSGWFENVLCRAVGIGFRYAVNSIGTLGGGKVIASSPRG